MTTEREWKRIGPIEDGGTVLGLCIGWLNGRDTLWATTGMVPFRSDDGAESWYPVDEGSRGYQLVTIEYGPPGVLIAGDLKGNILRSLDGGRSWSPVESPGRARPVACLGVSPYFEADGVVLLGTDGDGMWRSADNGRHWDEVNFGLLDLSVLAVACAPEWGRYEYAFAGTTDGVYRSRNGGRAWEAANAGLEGVAVSALAVSPGFSEDRTLFAATEEQGIYRSGDQGATWKKASQGLGDGGINALWISPHFESDGVLVAGTSSGVFRSDDGGERWASVAEQTPPVLCLVGGTNAVYAGVVNVGVLRSTDLGKTWVPATQGLSARNYARLLSCSAKALVAVGSEEGVVRSDDGGSHWAHVRVPEEHLPIGSLDASEPPDGPAFFLASTFEGGLIRSVDGGSTWEQVGGEANGVRSVLLSPDFEQDQTAWAGTEGGEILVTRDAGKTWDGVGSPCGGEPILRLAASPGFGQDRTLFAGTFLAGDGDRASAVRVWRSSDGGARWQAYLERESPSAWLSLALPPSTTPGAYNAGVFGIGSRVFRPSGGRRVEEVISPDEPVILDLIAVPCNEKGADLYAATSQGVFARMKGAERWKSVSEGLSDELILCLLPSPNYAEDGLLYALGVGSILWSLETK